MPELPDLTVYAQRLRASFVGQALTKVRLASPFLVRSVEPPLSSCEGQTLLSVGRIGKRLVFGFDDGLFLVLHLMIAGRLRAKKVGTALPRKVGLLALDFAEQTLLLTEASPKKRAALHVVRGADALRAFDAGGLEPLEATFEDFRGALLRESHTLKRSLTDPRLFAGIGNAYSDEILHRARLSPLALTSRLSEVEIGRLHAATQAVLTEWVARLTMKVGDRFPDKVTAFHPEMAVHGKFGQSCPSCGTKVQRIVRAENEVSYCPACQTGGRLLADRSLSRLLHEDWPATLEELEDMKDERRSVS